MDFRTLMNALVSRQVRDEFQGRCITLGDLISQLDACTNKDLPLVFAGCRTGHPDELASYRGFYEHLAVGTAFGDNPPTVAQFLERCRKANGSSFEGYKGGTFWMGPHTFVFAADYGVYSQVMVSRVVELSDRVELVCVYEDGNGGK